MFLKYGRSDIARQLALIDDFGERELAARDGSGKPEELVADLERMGPAYVKLGQLLSSRPDLLPPPYIKALSRLQDRVKPISYEQVERVFESELGMKPAAAFAEFERVPIAAASLGQVHRAVLKDGRAVVVKVQRPGIRKQIAEEMRVLEEIAGMLQNHTKSGRRYQLLTIFEEFKRTLIHELDYHREAANMVVLAKNLENFDRIFVPLPIEDYTTRRVLTMEHVRGSKITQIDPVARFDEAGAELADDLFKAYLKQVLVDGFFHADPHPGNIFLTEDGRIALLDLGMTGRLSTNTQDYLLKLLIAISEGRGNEAADLVIMHSETTVDFDEPAFRRRVEQLVAEQQRQTLQEMEIGKALLEMARSAGETGLFVPVDLSLLGKTLLQLDEIGRAIDPKFDPNAAVRNHVVEIMNSRVWKSLTPGNVFGSVLELKDFFAYLPTRMNKILDAVANSQLEVKIRAADSRDILDSLLHLANRITAGLILAALIVGASLLMQVDTDFRIFGYPGFGMLFFLIAASGGLWLVFNILVQDRKRKKKFK